LRTDKLLDKFWTHATDAGLLIMDGNGKPQYKAIFFFSKTIKKTLTEEMKYLMILFYVSYEKK
jgi:hypothetical protein